jgi:hypothetical protein
VEFAAEAAMLPTPTSRDHKDAHLPPYRAGRGPENSLPDAVRMLLPTPTAACSTGAGVQGRDGGPNLQTAITGL